MKTVNEPNQTAPQNTTKQVIRVTSNPNQNFQIPPVASDSSARSTKKISAISQANNDNNSAFRYRPKTLNTNTQPSDKNLEQGNAANIPSRRPTASNKNEPVYATVGSVNSNQRLVKNLKSANV